jgi:hypothetical protein
VQTVAGLKIRTGAKLVAPLMLKGEMCATPARMSEFRLQRLNQGEAQVASISGHDFKPGHAPPLAGRPSPG